MLHGVGRGPGATADGVSGAPSVVEDNTNGRVHPPGAADSGWAARRAGQAGTGTDRVRAARTDCVRCAGADGDRAPQADAWGGAWAPCATAAGVGAPWATAAGGADWGQAVGTVGAQAGRARWQYPSKCS